LEELAKKYGYSDKCKISNYIRFYENRDLIKSVVTSDNISYKKAMKVLRELKQKKGKLIGKQGQPFNSLPSFPLPYAFQ
jgi:hypothetical protein